MPAGRTGARGVALLLYHDAHPQSLCLIGVLVSNAAKGPLVQLLVGFGAHIQVLTDRAHIANDQLLDALLLQRVDQIAGLLVFDLLDLMPRVPCPNVFGGVGIFSKSREIDSSECTDRDGGP